MDIYDWLPDCAPDDPHKAGSWREYTAARDGYYQQICKWPPAEVIVTARSVLTEVDGCDDILLDNVEMAQSILSKADRGLTVKQINWLRRWISQAKAVANLEYDESFCKGLQLGVAP